MSPPARRGAHSAQIGQAASISSATHGLIALGVVVDRYVRGLQAATDDPARASAPRGLRLSAEGVTALGAVTVLRLTAAAQLSS